VGDGVDDPEGAPVVVAFGDLPIAVALKVSKVFSAVGLIAKTIPDAVQ